MILALRIVYTQGLFILLLLTQESPTKRLREKIFPNSGFYHTLLKENNLEKNDMAY